MHTVLGLVLLEIEVEEIKGKTERGKEDFRLVPRKWIINKALGILGWLSGLAPPTAQDVILETRDGVPRWAPCMEPASPSACVSASFSLSLCVSNE